MFHLKSMNELDNDDNMGLFGKKNKCEIKITKDTNVVRDEFAKIALYTISDSNLFDLEIPRVSSTDFFF
jgi:hypothetical protein